jgi:release factor glutamine methyltransferase
MMRPDVDVADFPAPDNATARTAAEMRRALAAKLRAGSIESPESEARILIGHALGLDHAALAAAASHRLGAHDAEVINALAGRRLAGEPIARILGRKEFWTLTLQIDDATLVPRPDTETVVEAALAAIDARGPRSRTLCIADLGTGCGALLLALLSELPGAFGIGSDTSIGALRVAKHNARQLQLPRATFVACDMATALHGPFDLIVSNPPYVASGDIAELAAEVRDFEPRRALDGGADGLDFYRQIAASAPDLLACDGALVVELGIAQAEPVAALFAAAGLVPSPARPDLSGVPRALLAGKMA